MTTETATRDDWHERSKEIGESAFASIAEMVGNLERAREIASRDFDWEEEAARLGFSEFKFPEDSDESMDDAETLWAKSADAPEDKRYSDAEEACRSVEEYPDEEEARRAIEEDPLSLQLRSGWVSPGEEMTAEEFELLLGTGGSAVRIIGEISDGEASRARLQVQDWFKPWTDYYCDNETLLTYCRCFYFGG